MQSLVDLDVYPVGLRMVRRITGSINVQQHDATTTTSAKMEEEKRQWPWHKGAVPFQSNLSTQ